MSDRIPPVSSISPIEPVSAIVRIGEVDLRVYQIYASLLATLFENMWKGLKESSPLFVPPSFSLEDKKPPLKRKKIKKKERHSEKKVERVVHSKLT